MQGGAREGSLLQVTALQSTLERFVILSSKHSSVPWETLRNQEADTVTVSRQTARDIYTAMRGFLFFTPVVSVKGDPCVSTE